jgi:formate hydrogenlyase subunit 3/multisubunit Na+/H+ antiporter MnhD subunit
MGIGSRSLSGIPETIGGILNWALILAAITAGAFGRSPWWMLPLIAVAAAASFLTNAERVVSNLQFGIRGLTIFVASQALIVGLLFAIGRLLGWLL